MDAAHKIVRPDKKGRISLGELAEGVSSFRASKDEEGRIILVPFSEVPHRERWVYDNPKVIGAIKQGLKDSAEGRIVELQSFARYADDEID